MSMFLVSLSLFVRTLKGKRLELLLTSSHGMAGPWGALILRSKGQRSYPNHKVRVRMGESWHGSGCQYRLHVSRCVLFHALSEDIHQRV